MRVFEDVSLFDGWFPLSVFYWSCTQSVLAWGFLHRIAAFLLQITGRYSVYDCSY